MGCRSINALESLFSKKKQDEMMLICLGLLPGRVDRAIAIAQHDILKFEPPALT
jgi:hypothetical protein